MMPSHKMSARVAFFAFAWMAVHGAPNGAPPNVVLMMADDQGWGDVGYNQYKYQNDAYKYKWTFNPPRTPNLDAWATADSSILFHRFYAGSGVCSPTRSAVLTGRTPDRECITSAEGCGQKPAWACLDKLPLPPAPFTVAEAAKKAGYSTIHIGKWHLGDFFYKGDDLQGSAYDKWPVSNPGMHGFDEWHSTEASASSSTTNCGCNPNWKNEGQGCIVGGGKWVNQALECTNYWSPMDLGPTHQPNASLSFCRDELSGKGVAAHVCVGNYTEKIIGDDTAHIMDVFEEFLLRKISGAEASPFLAVLWLHTVHEPHPSLPEFYHNYTDAFGDPAGDYLGTLTQMDVQIGRFRQMLRDHNVADNTMVWYTADNGPHSAGRDRQQYCALAGTNGLRQCKASLYEGGIRVPGILEWPAVIKSHSETWHPAYVSDYLPTVLEVLGVPHEHPDWAADGMSLMPLISQLASSPNVNDTSQRPADHPLVFQLGGQQAIVNNQWKILQNPVAGQCDSEKGSVYKGTMLFNLDTDPTESADLSKNPQYAALFANMSAQLTALSTSIEFSAVNESQCKNSPSPAPGPAPGPPVPPQPPASGFQLQANGSCLTLTSLTPHTPVVLGACDGGSKWDTVNSSADAPLANVAMTAGNNCLKAWIEDVPRGKQCDAGVKVTVAMCTNSLVSFDTSSIVVHNCPGMCVAAGPSIGKSQLAVLAPCKGASMWTKV